LRDKPIAYYPFAGRVRGHPSVLEGTIDEIADHASALESKDIQGIDLLAYRYVGDASSLLTTVVQRTDIPVVSAGSIASFDRILEVWKAGASRFTIGTAFFERQFVADGQFRDNVQAVANWLKTTPAVP
jgi:hypothetical protein